MEQGGKSTEEEEKEQCKQRKNVQEMPADYVETRGEGETVGEQGEEGKKKERKIVETREERDENK